MKINLLLILFIFIGCSSSSQKSSSNIEYFSVYKNDKLAERKIPNIDSKPSSQNNVGPVRSDNENFSISKKNSSTMVVALFLGPGLYRSLKYVNVLKLFEEYKLPLHILSGAGFGGIVSALYAKGLTPELIEWKFYKLFTNLNKSQVYSKSWKKLLLDFLKKEFKGLKIENLKKALILPAFDIKKNKVVYLRRGNLFNILVSNFKLQKIQKKTDLISPLRETFIRPLSYFEMGVEKLIVVDTLNGNVVFNHPDDYVFGIYAGASGKINKLAKHDYSLLLSLPDSNDPLDDYAVDKGNAQNTKDFLTSKLLLLKNFIKKKK